MVDREKCFKRSGGKEVYNEMEEGKMKRKQGVKNRIANGIKVWMQKMEEGRRKRKRNRLRRMERLR